MEVFMDRMRFLRRPAVLQKLGISRTHLYELERAGDFPAHFMLSPRCAVWDETAVDSWMEERAARRAVGTCVVK